MVHLPIETFVGPDPANHVAGLADSAKHTEKWKNRYKIQHFDRSKHNNIITGATQTLTNICDKWMFCTLSYIIWSASLLTMNSTSV